MTTHFPIVLEQQTDSVHFLFQISVPNLYKFAVPNQSEDDKCNQISVWCNKMSRIIFCVKDVKSGLCRWYVNFTDPIIICTQRHGFSILLNQTQIRMYLPYSDIFVTKQTLVWFQINCKFVNTILFQFDSIELRKKF